MHIFERFIIMFMFKWLCMVECLKAPGETLGTAKRERPWYSDTGDVNADMKSVRHPARSLGETCFLSKNSVLCSHIHTHTHPCW